MSQFKFENPDRLTDRQLWLIATSAMLTQLNHQRHDTLFPFGDLKASLDVKDVKQCLKRDWDVDDLASLSDTLQYLHDQKTLQPYQQTWEFLSDIEFNKTGELTKQLGSNRNVLQMIHNYQFALPGSDFGWHYGRCSWIIRMAAFVDYITVDEAWNLLEENGERIRNSFSSWHSFGLSYMVGAQYWKREHYTALSIQSVVNNFMFLSTNKQSPWLHVPWCE